MRFSDIVKDSEGCLSPYKVLSHLYRKCQHGGVEPEVHLENQRKVVCPILNLPIKATDIFIDFFHVFTTTWPEYAVGMVSWRQSSPPKVQYG